jgi:Spy/CpxP family protein refolding chaperone
MANSRIVLTLAGVFLAGVGTGMVGMRFGLHEQIHPAASVPQQPNQTEVLDRFRKELSLTDEQTQKLAAVLEDYRHYYQAVQEQIEEMRLRDQIDDLRSTGKNRILEILNAEQRQKFEKMTGVDPAPPPASK